MRQAIFVIGQNQGTNHPRMLTALSRQTPRLYHRQHQPLRERGLERFGRLKILGPSRRQHLFDRPHLQAG